MGDHNLVAHAKALSRILSEQAHGWDSQHREFAHPLLSAGWAVLRNALLDLQFLRTERAGDCTTCHERHRSVFVKCSHADEARQWFFSDECSTFMLLYDIDGDWVRSLVTRWIDAILDGYNSCPSGTRE